MSKRKINIKWAKYGEEERFATTHNIVQLIIKPGEHLDMLRLIVFHGADSYWSYHETTEEAKAHAVEYLKFRGLEAM